MVFTPKQRPKKVLRSCWTPAPSNCHTGTSMKQHPPTPLFCSSNRLGIEEGRAASKSPHWTIGYILSNSQQDVSADIIQNSAAGNFSPKTEGTKTKAARHLFFLMSFPFLYILNSLQCLHFAKFVCLLKRLQRLKQERQKSPAGTRQTYGKN